MSLDKPKSLTQHLVDSKTAQRIVVWWKLRQIINLLLEKFPIHRHFGDAVQYRIRRMESLIVADEIFEGKVYQSAIHPQARTVMDIGCNTGFFSLFCADAIGRNEIEGIAIDANPEMAAETKWHLIRNRVAKIEVINGVAGAPKTEMQRTFYISPSNIASSTRPQPNPNMPAKGALKAIESRAVNLAEEWEKLHPGKRIHILKIDVEGYEMELIKNSPELLALGDTIAIDIHKWVTSLEEIENLLESHGFELYATDGENTQSVVGFFKRRHSAEKSDHAR